MSPEFQESVGAGLIAGTDLAAGVYVGHDASNPGEVIVNTDGKRGIGITRSAHTQDVDALDVAGAGKVASANISTGGCTYGGLLKATTAGALIPATDASLAVARGASATAAGKIGAVEVIEPTWIILIASWQ